MAEEREVIPVDYSEFEGKDIKQILEEGQRALLIDLVSKCRSGGASHQELAILRNLLKDNGLVLGIPQDENRAPNREIDLPDFPEPDYLQ